MLLFVLTSFFVSSVVGTSYSFLRRILGTLHSTKTSGLNFWQLPVASGTAFSGISKKGGNLTRYTQIFFPEVFFPFNFAPKISRIFDWTDRISDLNSFRNFWKLFREISVPFAAVSKCSKVLLNGKRLWFIVFPPSLPLHFYSFPSSILSFLLFSLLVLTSIFIFSLLLLIFVVAVVVLLFLHFCFSSSFSSSILMFPLLPSSFFLFSLHHHHHISIVFPPPPPPPPPHFYCFPSTTTTATFHYLFRHPHQTGYMEGQKAKKIKKKIRKDFLVILCWKL